MSEQSQHQVEASQPSEEPPVETPHVDEVLTARQAARLLKISSDLLYESANRGDIPHRRIGRRMLFSRVALLAWLRESSVGQQPLRAVRRAAG